MRIKKNIQDTTSTTQYLTKKIKLLCAWRTSYSLLPGADKKNYPHTPTVKQRVRLIFQKNVHRFHFCKKSAVFYHFGMLHYTFLHQVRDMCCWV